MPNYVITEEQLKAFGTIIANMHCRVGEVLPLVDLIREVGKQKVEQSQDTTKPDATSN